MSSDELITKLQEQFDSEKFESISSEGYITEAETLLDEKYMTEEQIVRLEELKKLILEEEKALKEAAERKKADEEKKAQLEEETRMIEEMERIAEKGQEKLANALIPETAYDVAYDFDKGNFPHDLVNHEHTYLKYDHTDPTTEHFAFLYYSLSYEYVEEKIKQHAFIFVDPINHYAYEVEIVDY